MAAVVPPFYNFTGNYKPSGQDRTAAERNYVISDPPHKENPSASRSPSYIAMDRNSINF